jgi:hypothetical protein
MKAWNRGTRRAPRFAIVNHDHVQARVVGRLAARAGTPSQTTGIVEGLRLAVRGVNEVRVGRVQVSCKLVQRLVPDENAGT